MIAENCIDQLWCQDRDQVRHQIEVTVRDTTSTPASFSHNLCHSPWLPLPDDVRPPPHRQQHIIGDRTKDEETRRPPWLTPTRHRTLALVGEGRQASVGAR